MILIRKLYLASTFKLEVLRYLLKHHLEEAHGYEVEICDQKTFVPSTPDATVVETIQEKMGQCQAVVVILGTDYGSLIHGKQLSYLHFESIRTVLLSRNRPPQIEKIFLFVEEALERGYNAVMNGRHRAPTALDALSIEGVPLDDFKALDEFFARIYACKNKDVLRAIARQLANRCDFSSAKGSDAAWQPLKALLIFTLFKECQVHAHPFSQDFPLAIIEKYLRSNIKTFVTSTTYMDNDIFDYLVETEEGRHKAHLPRQGDPEYECEGDNAIGEGNKRLATSIKKLFIRSYGLHAAGADEFASASRDNAQYFVQVMLEDFTSYVHFASAAAQLEIRTGSAYFTDPAIGRKRGKTWLHDPQFVDIMAKTSEHSDMIIGINSRGRYIQRLFVFENVRLGTPEAEVKESIANAATAIFAQLGMGLNIGLFRIEQLDKSIMNVNDRNFYLMSNACLGFLDLDFPYIRMYRHARYPVWHSDPKNWMDTAREEQVAILRDNQAALDSAIIDRYIDVLPQFIGRHESQFLWQDQSSGLLDRIKASSLWKDLRSFRQEGYHRSLGLMLKGSRKEVDACVRKIRNEFHGAIGVLSDMLRTQYIGDRQP